MCGFNVTAAIRSTIHNVVESTMIKTTITNRYRYRCCGSLPSDDEEGY